MNLRHYCKKFALTPILIAGLSAGLPIHLASAGASLGAPSTLGHTADKRPLEAVVRVDLSHSGYSFECTDSEFFKSGQAGIRTSHNDGFKLESESALSGLLMAAQQSGLEVNIAHDHDGSDTNTPCY